MIALFQDFIILLLVTTYSSTLTRIMEGVCILTCLFTTPLAKSSHKLFAIQKSNVTSYWIHPQLVVASLDNFQFILCLLQR